MERKFVRSCSILLSAIILMGAGSTGTYSLSSVSVAAYAAETFTADNDAANAEASARTVSFSEKTDLGNLLLGDVNLQENEQEEKDYEVSSVTIEDYYAQVMYHTVSDCSLILGFYDDEGTDLLCAADIPVSANKQKITIDLLDSEVVEELPEHFLLKVSLADTETQTQLSSIYEYSLYTEAMQELSEMSVYDFDEEEVLNLDDDSYNNFAVYKDSTIVIKSSDGRNSLLSSDTENRIYVISAPDDTVLSLKKGDIFVSDYGDDIIMAKVLTTVIKGNTVTITGDSDFSAEDVFDYIKIDQSAGLEEAEVEVPEEEGVTFEGIYDKEGNNISLKSTGTSASTSETNSDGKEDNLFANNYEGSKEVSFKLYLEKGKKNQSETARAYIAGGVEGSLQFYLQFYLSPAQKYIQTGVRSTFSFFGEIGADFEWKVPLTVFHINIPKLAQASITPYLDIKAEGSLEGSFTISGDLGVYADDNGIKPVHESSFGFDGKVTASVFIGVLFAPEAEILDTIEIEWENRIGGEISGELALTDSHSEESSDEWHACRNCIDGDISVVGESSCHVKLSVLWNYDISKTWKFKLMDWYYSLDNKRFGFGECPFKQCRCNVSVVDMDGNPVPAAIISAHYINSVGISDEVCQADANGQAVMVLRNENIRLSAAKGKTGGSRIIKVSAPDSFVITMKCDDEEPEEYDDPYKTEKPDGNDPDSDPSQNDSPEYQHNNEVLDYRISHDDSGKYIVSIYGCYGDPQKITIPSYYTYEDKTIYADVVVIMNAAFKGKTNLNSVNIPGNVESIFSNAFEGCTNLKRFTVSGSVKWFFNRTFADCINLTKSLFSILK